MAKFTTFVEILLFATAVYSSRIGNEQTEETKSQIRSVLSTSEHILTRTDKKHCLEKLACLLQQENWHDDDNALSFLLSFVSDQPEDIDQTTFTQIQAIIKEFPHFESLADAVALGKAINDSSFCGATYQDCPVPDDELKSTAKSAGRVSVISPENDLSSRTRRESTCKSATGVACGGVSIGCFLCLTFTAGLCAVKCIPLSGIACAAIVAC